MKALIVGVGKLGFKLASALVDEDYDVTVIDNSESVIEHVRNSLDVMSICANALDFGVLIEIEIASYDIVISTTTNDEANVILCSISKKLGANFTIARVRDPEYHQHLNFIARELDIDFIINPDYATAYAIEKYLLKRYLLVSDEFVDGRVKLVEFNVGEDKEFVGKRLMDLTSLGNILVAAISRDGHTIIPNGKSHLEEKDVILLGGDAEAIEKFDMEHSGIHKARTVKRVMILGGGKTGFYLGLLLSRADIQTTIVEINRDRCMALKEMLPKVEVIHGDGTDLKLLEEEMVHTYDAFVTATGIDEANLLMSLVAKQMGMYKTVAKISRTNYNGIIDKLDIGGVFNTSYITASEILKVIRGAGSLSVNLLLNGAVEFTEIRLEESTPAVGKKVVELELPKGILIVTIVRGNEIIVPKGDTQLLAEDRLVIFSTHDQISVMKKIFQKSGKLSGFLQNIRFGR